MPVHSPSLSIAIVALEESHVISARALLLVAQDNESDHQAAPILSRLDRAARQENSESLGLAAVLDGEVVGIALFGMVAGAHGTAELHGVVVDDAMRRRGVGAALLRDVIRLLRVEQVRLLAAEIPDEDSTRSYRHFLICCGFEKECSIPDFVRDGVALDVYRLDYRSSSTKVNE